MVLKASSVLSVAALENVHKILNSQVTEPADFRHKVLDFEKTLGTKKHK